MTIDAHPEFPPAAIPTRDDTHRIKRLPCCLYLEDSYPEAKDVIAKDVNRVLDEFVSENIIALRDT